MIPVYLKDVFPQQTFETWHVFMYASLLLTMLMGLTAVMMDLNKKEIKKIPVWILIPGTLGIFYLYFQPWGFFIFFIVHRMGLFQTAPIGAFVSITALHIFMWFITIREIYCPNCRKFSS